MEYTVSFLFDTTGSYVLLERKARTSFAGKLNGVGGKVEHDEHPANGARREIFEETGVADIQKFTWLGNLELPWDCMAGPQHRCFLHFYAGIVENVPILGHEIEEPVQWCSVKDVITTPIGEGDLAGNGDVQYFVNAGWVALFT